MTYTSGGSGPVQPRMDYERGAEAERQRIATAVRKLPDDRPGVYGLISRAYVLAIIEDTGWVNQEGQPLDYDLDPKEKP